MGAANSQSIAVKDSKFLFDQFFSFLTTRFFTFKLLIVLEEPVKSTESMSMSDERGRFVL